MARQERETKRYVTWLPFLIDSARRIRRGWHISEKERILPKSKVLAPLSLVFPVLRVTYERIVAGGMLTPDDYRLASELLSRDPSSFNDPSKVAWFISASSFASERERLVPPTSPLPLGSSPTEVDPSRGEAVPSPAESWDQT